MDKIELYFREVFEELYRLKNEVKIKNILINDLKKIAYELNYLASHPSSSLALLYKEIYSNENFIDYQITLNKLIKISSSFPSILDYTLFISTNTGKPSFTSIARSFFVSDYSIHFNSDFNNERISEINKASNSKAVISIIKNLLEHSLNIINEELFQFLKYKTFTSNPLKKKIISEYELEYYQKWLDNTITYKDLSQNSRWDISEYVLEQKIDFKISEQIDKKKEDLFKEGVSIKLKGLINDLSEISKRKRVQTIATHKQLLKTFLQGDTSPLLIERLNVFLKITKAEQVILQYDKLLHSEYYNHYELNVFEPKEYRQLSAVFNAHLIYEYLKVLDNPKSIPDDYEEEFEEKIIEKTRLSLKFNGDESKLLEVVSLLQLKIDLLNNESKIEYLIDVLTSEDISEYNDDLVIGCETKQFAYVLTSLKPYFNNLTMKSIEDCNIFKSKRGNPLTANNLYLKDDLLPKKSADIDKAINLMQ